MCHDQGQPWIGRMGARHLVSRARGRQRTGLSLVQKARGGGEVPSLAALTHRHLLLQASMCQLPHLRAMAAVGGMRRC